MPNTFDLSSQRWLKVASFCPARLRQQVWNLTDPRWKPSIQFVFSWSEYDQSPVFLRRKRQGLFVTKRNYLQEALQKSDWSILNVADRMFKFFPPSLMLDICCMILSRIKHVWYLLAHIGLRSTEVPQKPMRKSRPTNECCLLLQLKTWRTAFWARILPKFFFPPFCLSLQKKRKKNRTQADDVDYIILASVESLLQTTGVWFCVLDEPSTVCIQRIILLKKIGQNCPFL